MGSLRDELQTIYDRHGMLTPGLVVEVARPENHPLHNRIFDRDLEEAAESWYLHKAETLIRSVKVRRTLPSGRRVDVRAFSPVRLEQPGVYDPLDKIEQDPVSAAVLLAAAKRMWEDLYTRYGHLEELLTIIKRDLAA